MMWEMYGYDLEDIIVEADSFDEAIAKAREINKSYLGGMPVEAKKDLGYRK